MFKIKDGEDRSDKDSWKDQEMSLFVKRYKKVYEEKWSKAFG